MVCHALLDNIDLPCMCLIQNLLFVWKDDAFDEKYKWKVVWDNVNINYLNCVHDVLDQRDDGKCQARAAREEGTDGNPTYQH